MSRRSTGGVQHLGGDRWRIYVEATPNQITGTRRRVSKVVRAKTRREARAELATFVTSNPTIEEPVPGRTVDELIDVWLEHLHVGDSTKAEWDGSLRRYVRPHIGGLVVADVDVELLERLWQQLQRDGGRNGGQLDVDTVRKARTALRLAFAQALRWKWIDHNPVAESKIPSNGKRAKVNAPEPSDVERVATAIDELDRDLATWLRLCAHLGARKEEALGLRWSAIDLDTGTVSIRTVVTLAGGRMIIVDHPKNTGSIRTVGIGRTHVAALKTMRARQMAAAIAEGLSWSDERFVLTPHAGGTRPYFPSSISRRVRKLQIRHKLPQVTIRQLRHHMATQAISRGHDVRTVAGRGGWANPDVLLRVYADWVPARDRALADDLDGGAVNGRA